MEKAFNNFKHNGIHLRFPNGNGISTIWGAGTYSDNYNYIVNTTDDSLGYRTFMSSDTCEVMILNCPDKLLKKIKNKYQKDDSGSVIGFLTIDKWLEIVKLLSK